MNIKPCLNDVPVALIFYARPDLLAVTFAAIRKARPKQLFLIQDGAKLTNESDAKNVAKCKEIVENIDWACEVRQNYSEENLGCGMRIYSGISWAFQYVDRLLIIEDDCVPELSLFSFTNELLTRYRDDYRIGLISGMNPLGVCEGVSSDYFFSKSGSIWGWATWKRVWDKVEYDLGFLDDNYVADMIIKTEPKLASIGKIHQKTLARGEKLSSWSYQFDMNILLQNQLSIIPKHNLITNIGLSENSANSVSSIRFIPKGMRSLYYKKSYSYNFPLKHPNYIVDDLDFKHKLDRLMANGYPIIRLYRTMESVVYRIFGGDFISVKKGFKRRLKIK